MKLTVKQSTISGRGVFAEEDIRKGEFIYRMGGQKVSLLSCIAKVVTGSVRMDDPLPVQKYQYLVLDELSILFNHSCQSNAGLANECDLVAIADIPRGQEITYDYSLTVRPSVFTTFWGMPCGCRAPGCRKTIGDARTVSAQHLQRYLEAGALQDFILDCVAAERR